MVDFEHKVRWKAYLGKPIDRIKRINQKFYCVFKRFEGFWIEYKQEGASFFYSFFLSRPLFVLQCLAF